MDMDDAPSTTLPPTSSKPIWQRPVSRRAVMATGAAGATAAAVAVLWKGTDLSQILERGRDLMHDYQGALSTSRRRAAHVVRRAGFGATGKELDQYAAMTTSGMTQAIMNYQLTSNAALEA